MRDDCIVAVAQALGRDTLTKQQAQAIEERVLKAMRMAARTDPAFTSLTAAQKLQQGAQLAAQQLVHEAVKQRQRVALQVQADAANQARLTGSAKGDQFKALAGLIERVDVLRKGVERQYFSKMIDTIESTHPKWLGLFRDRAGEEALVREIFGQSTGIPEAKAGAKGWLDTAEAMRQRWNAAGGDTGKLDYGYIPQRHNSVTIREIPADAYAQDVLPLLERSRYHNPDGSRMSDAQLVALLKAAHETIASEGLNKMTPGGQQGSGARANRRGEERVIHFKDADAWFAYHAKYGEGSVFTVMQGHVGKLARDIALVESFGPNPEHAFRTLHDMALKDGGRDMVGWAGVGTEALWREATGYTSQVYNAGNRAYQTAADMMQGVRNVEVFSKLQGAFLSSITDIPTFFLTTGYNRLPILQATTNLIRSMLSGAERKWANRAGLISESLISDMNRWAENNIGAGWTGKVSQATMRASLLEGWTNATRRAFSVTMMGALGRLSRTDWTSLNAADRAHLEAKGISAADWSIVRQATPEVWRGHDMLTPESIMGVAGVDEVAKSRTVSRILGAIIDESEYASVNPDLYTRAALNRGTQKATFAGEIARSIALFKSFPMAMISRHWGRAVDEGGAAGLLYGTKLAVGLTVFGGLAMQLKDMASGKDPRRMDDPKFWGAAFAQGGGAGILGDMLYTGMGGNSRYGEPNWTNLAGPVFSDLAELGNLTLGNIGEAMKGKDTHAGAELTRFVAGHTPFIRLWYAKSAIDHAFLHDMQEYLSPGYLARMEERARRDWGQGYYWRPGADFDDVRAPDFEKALGR